MTLLDLQTAVNKLVDNCYKEGIKPETIEVISRNASSDALDFVSSVRNEIADQEIDYLFGIPVDNIYTEITS